MEQLTAVSDPVQATWQTSIGSASLYSAKEPPKQYRMWSAIYHDRDTDNLFLWYDDGTMEQQRIVNTFYTPNRGQYGAIPCGMTDIYGKPMYVARAHTRQERDIWNNNRGPHNEIAEIDIDPRARFLQKHYEHTGMLKPDMKKINICFLDIEVETTGRFPAASPAAPYRTRCPRRSPDRR